MPFTLLLSANSNHTITIASFLFISVTPVVTQPFPPLFFCVCVSVLPVARALHLSAFRLVTHWISKCNWYATTHTRPASFYTNAKRRIQLILAVDGKSLWYYWLFVVTCRGELSGITSSDDGLLSLTGHTKCNNNYLIFNTQVNDQVYRYHVRLPLALQKELQHYWSDEDCLMNWRAEEKRSDWMSGSSALKCYHNHQMSCYYEKSLFFFSVSTHDINESWLSPSPSLWPT